jgi:DNA-binding transcriptional ArsR family regulator
MAMIDKARSHPLRRNILLSMEELQEPLSASAFARLHNRQGEVSNVSYHFRVLEDAALIDLLRQEPVRGSFESFYVPSAAFTATLRDEMALDRIADLLDDSEGLVDISAIARIVAATGRPVIRADEGGR